jgi:hypothetical protein
MRYLLYKCNREGGPAGYWGDWQRMVFSDNKPTEWGGHYSTRSPQVARAITEDLSVGDLVAAYQTDDKEVVVICRVVKLDGQSEDIKIYLEPIFEAATPLRLHEAKQGTPLETAPAVKSRVMLTEMSRTEAGELMRLLGAPASLLPRRP